MRKAASQSLPIGLVAGRAGPFDVHDNSLTYYLENEPATSLFAANQLFSSFAGVQALEKFIKNADDI
jgi:hypothetical protein